MSNNTEPAPTDDASTGSDGTSRSVRERLADIPEKRRSFLAGLAVGAAVLGGAWGITSAFDDGGDQHHRDGDMMQMRDHGGDRHGDRMGPMDGQVDGPMDGAGQPGGGR